MFFRGFIYIHILITISNFGALTNGKSCNKVFMSRWNLAGIVLIPKGTAFSKILKFRVHKMIFFLSSFESFGGKMSLAVKNRNGPINFFNLEKDWL